MLMSLPPHQFDELSFQDASYKWTVFPKWRAFAITVAFVREESGFSAHVVNLPGAVSQGETIEEAQANIADAAQGVLREYVRMGSIPWSDEGVEFGDVACYKRILVDV